MPSEIIAIALAALASCGHTVSAATTQFTLETCEDLVAAVAATADGDVTAIIDRNQNIDCYTGGSAQTLLIEGHELTVETAPYEEGDFVNGVTVFNARFEVASGAALAWEPDVQFEGNETATLEVNGGWLNVAEDAEAVFLGDVLVETFVVRCETGDDTDFCDDQWDGGCAWNQGHFEVDGHATFTSCGNFGGGESSPGRGGALFNGETGYILFKGGVTIEDTTLTDDLGNNGAGMYNAGEVEVKGTSRFKDLIADTNEAAGGAIFNAEGAEFTFGWDAPSSFVTNRANQGGAVYNEGIFKFLSRALFTDCDNSAVHNAATGELTFSKGTVFWGNSAEALGWGFSSDAAGGALYNEEGGKLLDVKGNPLKFSYGFIFEANTAVDGDGEAIGCENVYIQETAGTSDSEEEFSCVS